MENSLGKLRENIDVVDLKILELLATRQKIAVQIGEIKKETGMPIYDPTREKELIIKLQKRCDDIRIKMLIPELWGTIMKESRRKQDTIKK